jgi:hypothetical protein
MEYESKLSDIIASLPEVAGGFLFAPGKGLYSNQTIGITDADSLQQVGIKLSKIVTMLTVHFHDTKSIRVNFKDLILYGTGIQNGHWLFLLHQPSLSPEMLKMTVQMALNIEEDPLEYAETQSNLSSPAALEEANVTPSQDIMATLMASDSELSAPLTSIRENLALHIGPIAQLVFEDSIDVWAANGQPSLDRIPDLIGMLEEEIDSEDARNSLRHCIDSTSQE